MPRKSYNPSLLEGLKKKRSECTVQINKKSEPYKHCAMVVSRKGKGSVIGYGVNTFNNEFGSIHAEASAIKKARFYLQKNKGVNLKTTTRRYSVDVIVMRSTGANSRPCYHCITEQLVDNRHFNVRKVIYSDSDEVGGYVTTNCNKLYKNRENHFSGFHTRNANSTSTHTNCDDTNCDNAHYEHNHEHDCCELDEDTNEDDDEALKRLITCTVV